MASWLTILFEPDSASLRAWFIFGLVNEFELELQCDRDKETMKIKRNVFTSQ